MDKSDVPGTGLQANERYIRGSNCMKRYGYRISPTCSFGHVHGFADSAIGSIRF